MDCIHDDLEWCFSLINWGIRNVWHIKFYKNTNDEINDMIETEKINCTLEKV